MELLVLGVLAGLAYLTLSAGPLESVVYLVVAGFGVAMSVIGACLVRGSRRRVWVIMAVGQVLYFAGDVLWVIYEQILTSPPTRQWPTPSTSAGTRC